NIIKLRSSLGYEQSKGYWEELRKLPEEHLRDMNIQLLDEVFKARLVTKWGYKLLDYPYYILRGNYLINLRNNKILKPVRAGTIEPYLHPTKDGKVHRIRIDKLNDLRYEKTKYQTLIRQGIS